MCCGLAPATARRSASWSAAARLLTCGHARCGADKELLGARSEDRGKGQGASAEGGTGCPAVPAVVTSSPAASHVAREWCAGCAARHCISGLQCQSTACNSEAVQVCHKGEAWRCWPGAQSALCRYSAVLRGKQGCVLASALPHAQHCELSGSFAACRRGSNSSTAARAGDAQRQRLHCVAASCGQQARGQAGNWQLIGH